MPRFDDEEDGYYGYHVVSQRLDEPRLDRSRSFTAAQTLPSLRRNYSDKYSTIDEDDATQKEGSYYDGSEKTWQDEFNEGRALKSTWVADTWQDEAPSRWRKLSGSWISRLLLLLLVVLAAIVIPIFVTRSVRDNHKNAQQFVAPAAATDSAGLASALAANASALPTTTQVIVTETTVTSLQTQTATVIQEVFETVTLFQPKLVTAYQTSYQGGSTGQAQVYTTVQTTSVPVTATLSSASGAAPAQPTQVSGFPSGAEIFSNAYATFFLQNNTAGNCGAVNSDSSFVVALTTQMYGSGQYCGKTVFIRRVSNGATVTAKVADSCPTCETATSLDLSVAAFRTIATDAEGFVPIQWAFLD